ncbi:MAG: DUF1499 domain-containing protein [Bacteroidota bacterium]
MSDLPTNPLPPCGVPTNCTRETRPFDRDPEVLFAAALEAVRAVRGLTIGSAKSVEQDADGLGFHAVFSTGLFTDDLHLRVEPHQNGAVLHVRSASRVGLGDLGVNRRRVRALFDALT